MEWNIIEALAYLLATAFVVAINNIRQRRRGPWREKTEALEREVQQLRNENKRNLDLINYLQNRVDKLAHYEELYTTLKEAHDGLKRDHEELKALFEVKVAAWKEVTDSLNNERARVAQLEAELRREIERRKTAETRADVLLEALRAVRGENVQEPAAERGGESTDAAVENQEEQKRGAEQ